jgi:hypothetical protein
MTLIDLWIRENIQALSGLASEHIKFAIALFYRVSLLWFVHTCIFTCTYRANTGCAKKHLSILILNIFPVTAQCSFNMMLLTCVKFCWVRFGYIILCNWGLHLRLVFTSTRGCQYFKSDHCPSGILQSLCSIQGGDIMLLKQRTACQECL